MLAAVHEAGHVVAGRLAGFYVTAAGLGSGPWFLRIPLGPAFNLFVGANLLGGGATVAFPARPHIGRFAQAGFHYGGVFAQGLLHLGLVAASRAWPGAAAWLHPVIVLNGLAAGANLLPLRIRVRGLALETDGALAADALGGRGAPAAAAAHLVAARAVHARPRIGNPVGRFVLDLCVAAAGYPLPAGFSWSASPPPGTPSVYVERFRQEAGRITAGPGAAPMQPTA